MTSRVTCTRVCSRSRHAHLLALQCATRRQRPPPQTHTHTQAISPQTRTTMLRSAVLHAALSLAAAPMHMHIAGAAAATQQLLLQRTRLARPFSTQFEEAVHVATPNTTSQHPESPPITPDSSTGHADHTSDGRSSQTTSAYVAEEPIRQLVHQVLRIYDTRSLEEQRSIIAQLYDPQAVYENNATLLHGRDEITKRFALLPMTTTRVTVEYEKPVVLGATTSAPEALNDLSYKGDLQVEVSNTQRLSFDRGHSLWRMLLLPHGDVDLSVLTRLTLSQDHKVLYHRDIWTKHGSQWWAPLQRCWGVLEKTAGAQAQKEAAQK